MAGQKQSWRTPKLLIILSLLSFTKEFEVKEDEWEELGPDIAALHRLRGLSEHMYHHQLMNPSKTRETTHHQSRLGRSVSRLETDQSPESLLDGFQNCDNFTTFVNEKKKDFDTLLEHINKQKVQDRLLSASEISHNYGQKLLIMTDEEESTSERVHQEYSMDPHYSVKVSKHCLLSESCIPETDSYTVVKIFGHVSEDGQTVSGLSGSSLANLILKPSLEAAPVFSLDGNTTKAFQHNFIRVFMLHGLQAVLETNQNNHQIYHLMDQPDSVSSYKIPPRPVDHSTQYDHQQIIIMEDDPVVRKAATYLYEKHPAVSSVYVLDENQRPKLFHGESVPLSEDSRLVLVGHGKRDSSGEMRLAGYSSQDVSKIIGRTNRVSDKIKTTSVVACKIGSDKSFIETLLKELHETTGIETELHVRDAVLQVRHTGEKITQEISLDGLQWRHKDNSKKVVATLDRNKDVIIRNEPGSIGEAVFTNERNFLAPPKKQKGKKKEQSAPGENIWPDEPKRFINPDVFKKVDQNKFDVDDMKLAIDELQGMTWGFFHSDQPPPEKINANNLNQIAEEYIIGKREHDDIKWINDEREEVDKKLKEILNECYEIRSGIDVRNIILHYAKKGEDKTTYLMINDWIYEVGSKNLYVYLVGKKLDNNQGGNNIINDIKKCIFAQRTTESYDSMRGLIGNNRNYRTEKAFYAKYVKNIFLGEHTDIYNGKRRGYEKLFSDAIYTTYFTASVISESARNFRTFPLVLMALNMFQSTDQTKALDFLFEKHSMARGGSWKDENRRGFADSDNEYIELEYDMFANWRNTVDKDTNVEEQIAEIARELHIFEENSDSEKSFSNDYVNYKKDIERQSNQPSTSGTLGGYDDGHVTLRDLNSASELENTFKHESYFSRASASLTEEIHVQLKEKYGENLAGMHLQEGTARIENGQFVSNLVSEGSDAQPVEFRVDLSPESRHYSEKMKKNIDTAVHEMEQHSSASSHQVTKHVERAGTAVGTLGLMLGMKGAVRAFEQGDIKDGVVGSLQTVHGVTAMTTSVIAKQALSSETRIAKAAATIMRSPAMRRTMTAIPIVGIGFGIYNLEQDLKRGDALGYIDAVFDAGMVGLDVVELAQPELAPLIAPLNLALSGIRMVTDDIYMGIQNELNNLPPNAGVLEKLRAGFVGFGKGIMHFAIQVASLFYDWHYEEIEEGRRLVAQISDYHQYYKITKKDGMTAIDFTTGGSSWNGGGIDFCLADEGQSELCMDYFVSSDESPRRRCWNIDTDGSKDIILGLGESHQLEHQTLQKKVLMFIPAGSVTVVSGYTALSDSRYGRYRGNRDSNRFFAVQNAEDKHMTEVMFSYYYRLYGEPGDDTFLLGPQRSYVEGSGGKDTYIIPENGGKTIINNYDPSKAQDTLHFSVDYSHISVSKSGHDVVLMYEGSHTVTIQNWFLGESYRHMNMMSADGVLFKISSTVISSVQLVARGINKMFSQHGESVNASLPLLNTVTNIFGSQYDDVLKGNQENNLIDGGGGRDRLIGGEGEDIYMVKGRNQSSVLIENYSTDLKTDLAIIEANLRSFKVRVEGNDVHLEAHHDNTDFHVTLVNWFRSSADQHLLVITKDLITFSILDSKTDCLQMLTKCIKSHSIDYSSSLSHLEVDLQKDKAFDSVTEVRGSTYDDVIKGNKEHNVLIPGLGHDFMEGRGGEDWYVITPGQGVKTINNLSPDQALDILFLKEQYQHLTCTCEGQSIIILVHGRRTVMLQNWFKSKNYQHLQIKTSDGITAGLKPNINSCGQSLMLPLTVDYRSQTPEPLKSRTTDFQEWSLYCEEWPECYNYRSKYSKGILNFCGIKGKVMMLNDADSVKEMYGSSGFDIMVGNSNDNLLDPYTGGALMAGGEGKDTYIIRPVGENMIIIDNFAEDKKIDIVQVDMDFLDGSQVVLESSTDDVHVTITTKAESLKFTLVNYNNCFQHQHLEFQSSDGVHFKLKSLNSSGDDPIYQVEAFKVTLKQSQVDCRLDLNSLRNLSKVHTVQGCPSQSNDILGNNQDNALIGGWKDDALDGGDGDDTLVGGNGADILIGGRGGDTLYGEDGNDTLMGNSGRDVFIPGPGADLVDGGPGRDTVLYRGDHEKGKGVYVNLLTGQGHCADAEGDVLKDVETVIGTIYSDILVSGYESALLKGSDGNDILVSTGGDYLVGGDGNDIYLLAFNNGTVTIDNCAKDNATDVLYLQSQVCLVSYCQIFSDKVILTFHRESEETVEIALKGWIGDNNECSHLILVFRETDVSVDQMLTECCLSVVVQKI